MAKIIVTPDPGFFLEPAPPAPLAGAMGRPRGAVAIRPKLEHGLRTILAHRQERLHAFAALATTSALGVAMARGDVPEGDHDSETLVLEGIGALIMDDEMVDRAALEGALGAKVWDNVLVPLVAPASEDEDVLPGMQAAGTPWHLEEIAIGAARAKGLDGAGVLAGVLDTGIDASHPEFQGKTIHFREFDIAGRPLAGGSRDADRHGTHVCGLIAGSGVGVAPAAELAVAAVLTTRTCTGMAGYLTQIAAGLNWLVTESFRGPGRDPGADLLSASLGSPGYDAYLYQPLGNARFAAGTMMAAAIGNDGRNGINRHGSPGNYDLTIGVGAIDAQRNVADFSDWGTVTQHGGLRKPDFCAPGAGVTSSVPGGAYAAMSGTSMATPIVAGVMALLLQQTPALNLNAVGLSSALLNLVTPLAGATNLIRGGLGRLDLTRI